MTQWSAPSDIGSRPVAVIGGGVLGRRIATSWVAAGYPVILCDLDERQRNASAQYIDHNIATFAAMLPAPRKPATYSTVKDNTDAVKDAWLVVEVLPENLKLKTSIMGELDKKAPHDAIISSNSSSYKSSLMVGDVDPARRNRICNSHYMMPPGIRAVELMTCGHTDQSVLEFLKSKLIECGLLPVIARKESTGFIMARFWAAMKREALMILAEEVSEPKEIDQLFLDMFKDNPSGPCAMMDSVGLDTVAFIENNYVQEKHYDPTALNYVQKYVDEGKLGAKCNKGGLYPPGETTKSSKDESGHHDNLAAPQLYYLDVGLGGEHGVPDSTKAGKVMTASADGSIIRELVSNQPCPDGIDISMSANKMFWTCMGPSMTPNTGTVWSANLDGSDAKIIIKEGDIHTPKQMIVEHESKKLYICDREGMRIHRCNFDGSDHEILLKTGDDSTDDIGNQRLWCVGIAVDPKARLMYWTQKGAPKGGQGRIFRASIDLPAGETPSNRSDIEVLFDDLPEPIDLELYEDSLYWTDRGEYPLGNSLNVASIGSASKDRKILSRHLHEAIGLKVDPVNHHVYVSDLGGTIYRFNLDGTNRKKVISTDSAYTGLAMVFPQH